MFLSTFILVLFSSLQALVELVSLPEELRCIVDLPSCLSYREPLSTSLDPSAITILFGSESQLKRSHGSGQLAYEAIQAFAAHHQYRLLAMDEIDYGQSLLFGMNYHEHWAKVFAMRMLRNVHPGAKYFVYMDENILAPFPDTHLLNHYINMMEADAEWKMLTVEARDHTLINTSLIIFKNDDFCFHVLNQSLHYAANNDKNLVTDAPFEQAALAHLLRSQDPASLPHRPMPAHNPPHSLNTLYWLNFAEAAGPLDRFQYGDGLVRLPGGNEYHKLRAMRGILEEAAMWRKGRPESCSYPVTFLHSTT